MGKSKRVRKQDVRYLRQYARRRELGKWLTIGSGAAFVAVCMIVGGFSSPRSWLTWAFLGLYIVCFTFFRIWSRCPYCGRSILRNYRSITHCPYCKRPVKEQAPSRDSRDLIKTRK